jgi:glycosyltransferase involved in cell wall biosynthesis
MKTLAVIPAHNEEATVGVVVARLAELGLESVVIDDGSADHTAASAAAAGAVVLCHPTNIGVGGALRTGFAYAVRTGYQRVVCVDADLQHEAGSIADLLAAAEATGAELMIGSRFEGGDYTVSGGRRLLMRFLARWVSRRVGAELDDVTSGFRVVTDPLLSRFAVEYPTEYLGDTVEAIMAAHRAGASIAQTGVRMGARSAGDPTSRLHAAGHLLRLALVLTVTPRRS